LVKNYIIARVKYEDGEWQLNLLYALQVNLHSTT
jgi:hypothetical protein